MDTNPQMLACGNTSATRKHNDNSENTRSGFLGWAVLKLTAHLGSFICFVEPFLEQSLENTTWTLFFFLASFEIPKMSFIVDRWIVCLLQTLLICLAKRWMMIWIKRNKERSLTSCWFLKGFDTTSVQTVSAHLGWTYVGMVPAQRTSESFVN